MQTKSTTSANYLNRDHNYLSFYGGWSLRLAMKFADQTRQDTTFSISATLPRHIQVTRAGGGDW